MPWRVKNDSNTIQNDTFALLRNDDWRGYSVIDMEIQLQAMTNMHVLAECIQNISWMRRVGTCGLQNVEWLKDVFDANSPKP